MISTDVYYQPSARMHVRVIVLTLSFIHSVTLSAADLKDGCLPGFENGIKVENLTI